MNDKLNNVSSALSDEQERKRRQKAALMKMVSMLVLFLVVWIFGAIDIPIKQMTAETA